MTLHSGLLPYGFSHLILTLRRIAPLPHIFTALHAMNHNVTYAQHMSSYP